MHSFIVSAVLATIAIALQAHSAAAALVARWDMTDNLGNELSESAVFTAPNLSAAVIARGPFLDPIATGGSLAATGFEGADPGAYFSLSFNVAAGFLLDLETLSIGTRSSATGPGTIGVFTSADAFAAPITTISQAPGNVFAYSIIDLSLLPTFTGAFEIRFIEVGNTQADGVGDTTAAGTFRITDYVDPRAGDQDIQLLGVVAAVPEASSFVLGGFVACGVGLAYALRKKRGSSAA